MSSETPAVDAVDDLSDVNGSSESHPDENDSVSGDPGPSKLSSPRFKVEFNEGAREEEPPATDAPRHGIRVKRELLSFQGNTSKRHDGPEADKQDTDTSMIDFPGDCPCHTCGAEFLSFEDLQKHQPTCRPTTRAYICDICQENFERKSDLNNHIVCHQVNRPHACRLCGSLFRKKADLMSHIVTHQVDKPHKCGTCGLEFQRHSSLTNHMKIHTYTAGRAFHTKPFPQRKVNYTPLKISTSKKNQLAWQPLERSTEPIPSFETLPVPGFSYYNNLAVDPNYATFLANKAISNAGLSPKVLNQEVNSLIPSSADLQSTFPTPSVTATQITCLPDIGPGAEPHGDLPADFQMPQQTFTVDEQTEFDNAQEIETSQPNTEALNSYLSVKNAGLLYGIKVEGQYNEHDTNAEQPSLGSPDEQPTMADPQQENHLIQPVEESTLGKSTTTSLLTPNPQHDSSKPHMCQFCGIYFARLKAYQSHMRLHDDSWEATYQCQLCGQNFPDYVTLSLHTSKCMRGTRKDDDYTENVQVSLEIPSNQDIPAKLNPTNKQFCKHACVNCGKKFATKQKLFRHMWIHRKKLFTCEACGDIFDERELLDKHRLEFHPPNESTRYACQTCGKSFTSRQTLWEHGRVHGGAGSGAALLWCQECNKSFASRQGYQIHTRTHTGERPYGCRYCLKSFRDGGTLRKHERIHTGERPHVCPLCLRAFNQKVVLREHVRWVHAATTTGEPPLPCVLCGTGLPDREALCAHIVKHSDEMAAEARAATRSANSANNARPRRPTRKNNKLLVQAADGRFVSVEKEALDDAVSDKPTSAAQPNPSTTNTESMDESSHSTPESPFRFPKMEPQSERPCSSAIGSASLFVYSNDAPEKPADIASTNVTANADPKTPGNHAASKSSTEEEELESVRIRIPGFNEIAPKANQSLQIDEPAPNVTVADVPDSHYFINQDMTLPATPMETDMVDPMTYIQVVTEINPQDVMSQLNVVIEDKKNGANLSDDVLFDQSSKKQRFVQENTVGLGESAKDGSRVVRCEICHEELPNTNALIEHVNSHN